MHYYNLMEHVVSLTLGQRKHKNIPVVFHLISQLLLKQHTLMHMSTMSPCTGQGVNSTNKRKLVSFNCVLAALPVNRTKKTTFVTQESWETGLDVG